MKGISQKLTMLLLMGLFPLSAMAHSANSARGAEITLTAILVVVVVFALLYFALAFAGRTTKEQPVLVQTADASASDALTENELAAISIALYKYSKGLRESENSARMMNKTAKAHSAWTLRRYNSRPIVRRR